MASVALVGAEAVSWKVGGRELLWHGDPAWWDRTAPLLFPVVGASNRGLVTVDGRDYPMPQHGFAKDMAFRLIEYNESSALLRLSDDNESWSSFPFAFQLDVRVTLADVRLDICYEVFNPGSSPLPYAIGFHPGFLWPVRRGEIVFESEEKPTMPCIATGGLLARRKRCAPLKGRKLPLDGNLFDKGALVFLDAQSKRMILREKSTAEINFFCEGFQHLVVWSKPEAPFLALEAWSGQPDWEDYRGELVQRDGMTMLQPGETKTHSISICFQFNSGVS